MEGCHMESNLDFACKVKTGNSHGTITLPIAHFFAKFRKELQASAVEDMPALPEPGDVSSVGVLDEDSTGVESGILTFLPSHASWCGLMSAVVSLSIVGNSVYGLQDCWVFPIWLGDDLLI